MDFSKFIQFPGVLVLAGVLLLVIALIISISSAMKKKKGNDNINQPAKFNNDVASGSVGLDSNMNAVNMEPNMTQNNMMSDTSIKESTVVDDNPMGMPLVNDLNNQTVNEASNNNQVNTNPMEINNPDVMTSFDNPVEPIPDTVEEVSSVSPVMPELVEEKKEPVTNPWANASTAYGGANPMDGVDLNFSQGQQEPYGEKNFTVSETPTINVMSKEEKPIIPTINDSINHDNVESSKDDDVETL